MTNSKIQRMYCYVVAYDTGFAPNPFHGFCTLACCESSIRKRIGEEALRHLNNESELHDTDRIRELGLWVIGLASETIKKGGYILYAMQVTKILTFAQYWNDPDCVEKKPSGLENGVPKEAVSFEQYKMMCGDNIYDGTSEVPVVASFHSIPNQTIAANGGCGCQHNGGSQNETKGKYVLISDNFVYFSPNYDMKFDGGALAKRRGTPIFEADSDYHFDRLDMNKKDIVEQFEKQLIGRYNDLDHLPNSVGKPNSPHFPIREA